MLCGWCLTFALIALMGGGALLALHIHSRDLRTLHGYWGGVASLGGRPVRF